VLDLMTPVRTYHDAAVGLAGRHQAWNAALAVRAAELVFNAEVEAVREGLAKVRKLSGLAGRCELLNRSPLILADVAHNAGGLRAALAWARDRTNGLLYVLFGTMRDKDLASMADALRSADARVLPVPLATPRSVPYDTLCGTLRARGVSVIDVAGVREGLDWFCRRAGPADGLLVTGSHLTVIAAQDALGTPSAP
jgi:dihydrofolate synthase/folylpolyglutamate synthase